MFGGGVKGKFVSLSPPKEFVQTWALSSPTWPSGKCPSVLTIAWRMLTNNTDHFATLTTTLDQGSDSTKVTWSLKGVPLGMEEEITRNLQGY